MRFSGTFPTISNTVLVLYEIIDLINYESKLVLSCIKLLKWFNVKCLALQSMLCQQCRADDVGVPGAEPCGSPVQMRAQGEYYPLRKIFPPI